jgi:WD40 repeat protein
MQITGRAKRKENYTYWHANAADFYTQPEDAHLFPGSCLPYCTASCNTNTLIAIGDEMGSIRIMDTARDNRHGFSSTYLTIQPHLNAVMDMAFSSDDSMLATASGDQTSRIIDMQTQKVKYVMHAHSTSVKQVRFQPDNDNVLATSSRDGDIHIWDMRCKGSETMIAETTRPTQLTTANLLTTQYKAYNAMPYNSILAAHATPYNTADDVPSSSRDAAGKEPSSSAISRNGIVSVTALAFLNSPGRSHLLLSGSESSTTLRLWDIRNRYTRRGPPTPLSTTLEPESHARHRHFGVNSLMLNQQGSRVYALSRDNTIYAYSAAHLINGHAPELERNFATKHQRSVMDGRKGLGPLYGLRHPRLHATTFYVKAALRQAKDHKAEMLAIGSADGCAVLFPTDESCFPSPELVSLASGLSTPLVGPTSSPFATATARPLLRRAASSNFGLSARMRDTIPIYNVGTALVEGHSREVTDVTWTHDGDLITLSDDHTARLWREGPQAHQMRTAKDGNAMRAGWGWADVESDWDKEDWE